MKHLKYLLQGLTLAFIILFFICITTKLVTPKHYDEWASTYTYDGFYAMPENSLEIVFLGSSHAVSFFSPQEIYNTTKLRSYNLGCEQQNLLTSYYWLVEALKSQSPKVVVLETYFLFPYELGEETPITNFHEGSLHKAFDYMKPSFNKLRAVYDICNIDNSQTMSSYLFPLMQYHTRWKELSKTDFTYLSTYDKYYNLKGYAFFDHVSNYEFNGYETIENNDTIEMVNTMKLYLNKIVSLCQEQNINLILVTTPTNQWTIQKHNCVANYAQLHAIDYIDFCSSQMMYELQYTFAVDNSDYGHGNICGATKISNYLAKYILQNTNIDVSTDIQWEIDNTTYLLKVQECLENIVQNSE